MPKIKEEAEASATSKPQRPVETGASSQLARARLREEYIMLAAELCEQDRAKKDRSKDRAKIAQTPSTAARRTLVGAAHRAIPAAPNTPNSHTRRAAPVPESGAVASTRPSIPSPSPPSSPRMLGGGAYGALPAGPNKPYNPTHRTAPFTTSVSSDDTLSSSPEDPLEIIDQSFSWLDAPARAGVMNQDYRTKEHVNHSVPNSQQEKDLETWEAQLDLEASTPIGRTQKAAPVTTSGAAEPPRRSVVSPYSTVSPSPPSAPRKFVGGAYSAQPAVPTNPNNPTHRATPVTAPGAAEYPRRAIPSPSPPPSPRLRQTLDLMERACKALDGPAQAGVMNQDHRTKEQANRAALYAKQQQHFEKDVQREFEESSGQRLPDVFWLSHRSQTTVSRCEETLDELECLIARPPRSQPQVAIEEKFRQLSKRVKRTELLKQMWDFVSRNTLASLNAAEVANKPLHDENKRLRDELANRDLVLEEKEVEKKAEISDLRSQFQKEKRALEAEVAELRKSAPKAKKAKKAKKAPVS